MEMITQRAGYMLMADTASRLRKTQFTITILELKQRLNTKGNMQLLFK